MRISETFFPISVCQAEHFFHRTALVFGDVRAKRRATEREREKKTRACLFEKIGDPSKRTCTNLVFFPQQDYIHWTRISFRAHNSFRQFLKRERCKFIPSSGKKRDEKNEPTSFTVNRGPYQMDIHTNICTTFRLVSCLLFIYNCNFFLYSFVALASFNRFSQQGIHVNIIASISLTVVYFFLALDRHWLQCASWSGMRWPSSIQNARRSRFGDNVVGWKATWMNSKITRLAWESEKNTSSATQFLNSPRQSG